MKRVEINNAGCFVIPNSAGRSKDFFSSFKDTLKDIMNMNKLPENEDEQFVQLWFFAPDYNTENVARHGIIVDGEFYRPQCEHIPLSILKDVKEGGEFSVKVPAYNRNDDTVEVTIHGKATQQGYRYQRFGNFEDVVRHVCA